MTDTLISFILLYKYIFFKKTQKHEFKILHITLVFCCLVFFYNALNLFFQDESEIFTFRP